MPEEIKNQLVTMELHDEIEYYDIKVLKVPGGWIYRFYNSDKQNYENPVFVPWNANL